MSVHLQGCFKKIEHTPKPLPTGYQGILFWDSVDLDAARVSSAVAISISSVELSDSTEGIIAGTGATEGVIAGTGLASHREVIRASVSSPSMWPKTRFFRRWWTQH